MLALLASLLVALYLLGPDLISRWILGFAVPRRNLVQSRGEEITRAILWAAFPLAFAIFWATTTGVLRRYGTIADLQVVFASLDSDRYFDANHDAFFHSIGPFLRMNLALLWRLYLLVLTIAIGFNVAILRYNQLWNWHPKPVVRFILTSIILPRVSEWHVLLSGMRLPPGPYVLSADILTRSNTLYQGRVDDKMLNPDGSLHTITLASPRRFLRDEFDAAHAGDPEVDSADFWKSIPGNLFVVLGSDIVNINLKYLPLRRAAFKRSTPETKLLQSILARLDDPSAPR